MAGKFAGVGRAARWLALLGAMAASGGAFAAQEGGVPMPALSGAVEWLNSPPLTRESFAIFLSSTSPTPTLRWRHACSPILKPHVQRS